MVWEFLQILMISKGFKIKSNKDYSEIVFKKLTIAKNQQILLAKYGL